VSLRRQPFLLIFEGLFERVRNPCKLFFWDFNFLQRFAFLLNIEYCRCSVGTQISLGTVNENSSCSPVGSRVCLCMFLGCMIYLYVCVCFVLSGTVESFPFMFWRRRNKVKWAPFELVALSSLLGVRSWLHPFKGHCEQQAMRDEEVIYVAGYPLLNRRCTKLPGCICLWNDLYCVGWGVKLYSLLPMVSFETLPIASLLVPYSVKHEEWHGSFGISVSKSLSLGMLELFSLACCDDYRVLAC